MKTNYSSITKCKRSLWTQRIYVTTTLLFIFILPVWAQQPMSLEQVIQTALQNNEGLKANSLEIDYYREIKRTSSDVGKLSATWMHGQYNSVYQDNNFTLTQSIPFPTAISSQARLGKELIIGAEKNYLVSKNDLVFEVKSVYYELLYLQSFRKILESQDSLYTDFAHASAVRFNSGESNLLEKTTAESQSLDAKNLLLQNQSDILIQQTRLQALLKSEVPLIPSGSLTKRETDLNETSLQNNPRLLYIRQQGVIGNQTKRVEQNRLLPDITFGYFNQSLTGIQNVNGQDTYYGSGRRFQGFQLGLAVPLWITPHIARIKAYSYREAQLKKTADYYKTTLSGEYTQALQESQKNLVRLTYYETSGLKNASLILHQSQLSFKLGEIGYIEYLQSLKTGIGIRTNYLQVLNQYNQSVIKVEHLLGNF